MAKKRPARKNVRKSTGTAKVRASTAKRRKATRARPKTSDPLLAPVKGA